MNAAEGARLLQLAQLDRTSQALAKFLTWLERSEVELALNLSALWAPERTAFRIGITGPPGAGKSTLVGRMLTHLRTLNLQVGVLAVDPSSPFSKGAILGDRIRYSEHFADPGIFIRSLGTRGSLGGLSSAAFLMARAFDAVSFDVLLIETVGVGQTELDVLHVADQVCVVLVPESGDAIQAMKAGLMEIADIFVVNKSDRPGAEGLLREIEAAVHATDSPKSVQVVKAIATADVGIAELTAQLMARSTLPRSRLNANRLREEAKALLRRNWEMKMDVELAKVTDFATFKHLLAQK